jgi:hypothetical protein
MHPKPQKCQAVLVQLASAIAVATAAAMQVGCDAHCPSGTSQVDDRCVSLKANTAAGSASAAPPVQDATGPTMGSAGAPKESDQGDTSGMSGAFARTPGQNGAAAGSGTAGTRSEGDTTARTTPCNGHPNEVVCDGQLLYQCDASGTAAGPQTCPNAALCQVGRARGSCAICTPDTFRCTGAELEHCTNDGQYEHATTCESAALCSASSASCTAMVCKPNARSCDADGTLRTCNADGSGFGEVEGCGRNLCDGQALRCMKCIPSPATCSGDTVIACSSDGQTVTRTACSGSTPRCANGRCVQCNTSDDCIAENDCVDPVCVTASHTCGQGSQKPVRTPCGGPAVGFCDEHGNCNICGNGQRENELCDPGLSAAGTCDPATCLFTDGAYAPCPPPGPQFTKCPVNGDSWFCAVHGACSRFCTTDDDCRTATGRGECVPYIDGSNNYCVVDCSRSCPAGLRCVDATEVGSGMLCGTASNAPM